MEHKILIACVGNIFLGDDAFGVEVARRFAGRELPAGVKVTDFGIRSYDLAYALMDDWDLVILVDAVPRGGLPGTVYVIEPELPKSTAAPQIDPHSMDPVAVLEMVAALGGKVRRMVVVGCEPSRADAEQSGMELSAPVRDAVDEAVRVIEERINSFPATLAGTVPKQGVNMAKKIAGITAIAGAAYALYFFYPEMHRYLRMRRM